MLDGVSLDQIRAFIAAVDEGSFSAAGRKLFRVQSAVSGWIGSLEAQLGVALFDRTARFPKLTPEGVLLLADARNIVSGVNALKARAKLMAGGLEAELSVVVDVFFPTSVVSAVASPPAASMASTRRVSSSAASTASSAPAAPTGRSASSRLRISPVWKRCSSC